VAPLCPACQKAKGNGEASLALLAKLITCCVDGLAGQQIDKAIVENGVKIFV